MAPTTPHPTTPSPVTESRRCPSPRGSTLSPIRAALSAALGIGSVALGCAIAPEAGAADASAAPAKAPLLGAPALEPLPLGSIRPAGWLERQLRIQANGLTGHLDEFWPDVQRSGWIGGDAEGWERMPYWLDGLVPLAFALDDAGLKAKAARHVSTILEHPQPDGWLGPEKSAKGNYKARDPWPVFVAMKVLTQYAEATGDPRVIPAIARFLRTLDRQLDERPLFEWNRMRWQDGVVSVYWLFDRTGEGWLLDLARKIQGQGYGWRAHFEDLPHKQRATKWEHESHVVNNAMGVKAPAVWYRQSGDPGDRRAALGAIETLDRYHGQASGVFTGDECLAGRMPSQGTETCAVVEYLYSLEVLASVLGDASIGDRIELVAFNALPAPFKPDLWARQYDQQSNQALARVSEPHVYTTNGPDANLFGLETNYGCCTANLHQGWPKLAAHLWMKTADGGLAAVAYAPAVVSAKLGEGAVAVRVEVRTEYPFGDRIDLRVVVERPVRFPLRLRVPTWAEGATLDEGERAVPLAPGAYHSVEREWSGETELALRFPMRVRIERRYQDAVAVKRGPLVYSLHIGTEWRRIRGEAPHADWEVHPTTPWNYALELDATSPERSFDLVSEPEAGPNPFDPESTPVRLRAKGRRLPTWGLERNAAAPPPRSPVSTSEPLETLTLIPYGAAKLRITELPTVGE